MTSAIGIPTWHMENSVLAVGSDISSGSVKPAKKHGHFCDLFIGEHVTWGTVALKRPRVTTQSESNGEVIRRFQWKPKLDSNYSTRKLLRFIGIAHIDGGFYLVSPFAQKGTILEYLKGNPDVLRIELIYQAAKAIAYLHSRYMMHGDIKAANILFADDGSALLCDFGLTRHDHSITSTAMAGSGALRWQAPELWDSGHKSFQTDVYAFGITNSEILAGKIPFPNITNDTAVIMVVAYKEKRPPETPAESLTGESYTIAWTAARSCWVTASSERPKMVQIVYIFSAGRSAILFTFDHAAHARSYLKDVENYLATPERYILFLQTLQSYRDLKRPFFEVYEKVEKQLASGWGGSSLFELFAFFFPYYTAFDLPFHISQRARDPMNLEEQRRLVGEACGPPHCHGNAQDILPFKSEIHSSMPWPILFSKAMR